MNNRDIQFDVAVVGAGPAGLMAAVCSAKKGLRVALIEKKDRPGIKLLMTGNGRCNLTQAEFTTAELVKKYGKNGRFLFSALNEFGPKRVMDFFNRENLKTKIEKGEKVFPKSDQSKDVLNVFIKILKDNGVNFFYESDIVDFEMDGNKIAAIITKKRVITANKYIIAVGGMSYPNTGSTGDGYAWAEKFGHTIVEPVAVLVPIVTKIVNEELHGVSVHNCGIIVKAGGKNIAKTEGDMIFTHFGVSGPAILNISREIAKFSSKQDMELIIDFKPYLSENQLDEILCDDLKKNAAKKLANCFEDLFSPKLRESLLKQSGLDMDKHGARVSKEERIKLIRLFKGFKVEIDSLLGFEKAMVTSGGVSTKEIDSKTMRSKLIENLYFAGEIIDIDGPTGGYNLQMCWSTGFLAGKDAAIV